jgi:hypothetical protein
VKSFNLAGIDYMFTGALAASYYGTPRTTMDAGVIVRISLEGRSRSEFESALKEAGVKVEKRRIDTAFESRFR